jgi:tetratricopeptide (TPR) repeat protein
VQSPSPKPPFFATPDARRLAWLCGAAIVLAALALNLRSLGFGFLYLRDDDVNIALNPHMGGLSAERLRWMFTDTAYARRYLPLGWLNFSATYEFAGLDPQAYHAVALALYVANAALVFGIVLHVLRVFRGRSTVAGLGSWDVGAAALASAWWALHPMRVETTAWASGNLYGQSALLLFASLLAYLRTYLSSGRSRTALLCLSVAAFAASLLTYPIGLGVPVLLVCLDWLRTRGSTGNFRRLLAEKAAFFIPLAGMLAVTIAARYGDSGTFGPVPGMREMPLASRIAQSAYVAAYFIWKPWLPFHLSPLYDSLFDFSPTDWPFVLSTAFVIAASVYAVAVLQRRPYVAAVWFGYLAIAAPFFGLTEKPHMTSDRYGYLLTVVTSAVLAALLAGISRRNARTWSAGVGLLVIAALCHHTRRQLDIWTDDRTQHAYVARWLTNPVLLEDFTSRQLILEFLRGNEKEASRSVEAYLRVHPTSQGYIRAATIFADKRGIGTYYGPVSYLAILQDRLALRFAASGQMREADDHFGDALGLDDRFYQAAYDRSLVLLNLGRCEDALASFLWAESWAPSGLPEIQRSEFLSRLAKAATSEGKASLADAARRALART